MKAQELMVSCFYNDEGASIQNLIYSSFVTFLKRELGKFASAPDHHVDRHDEWSLISRRRLCT